jgi:hypothetical protein
MLALLLQGRPRRSSRHPPGRVKGRLHVSQRFSFGRRCSFRVLATALPGDPRLGATRAVTARVASRSVDERPCRTPHGRPPRRERAQWRITSAAKPVSRSLRARRSGSAFAGWRPLAPCREVDCAPCRAPAPAPAGLAEERCAAALEERSPPGEEGARRWGVGAEGGEAAAGDEAEGCAAGGVAAPLSDEAAAGAVGAVAGASAGGLEFPWSSPEPSAAGGGAGGVSPVTVVWSVASLSVVARGAGVAAGLSDCEPRGALDAAGVPSRAAPSVPSIPVP